MNKENVDPSDHRSGSDQNTEISGQIQINSNPTQSDSTNCQALK